MSTLLELQRALQRHVLQPDDDDKAGAAAALVMADANASAQRRLGVYAHAYRARLREVLGKDYRGLRALAGEDTFDAIAHDYVAATPSHHPNARWYGARLGAFLRDDPHWRAQPQFADMAALDWAFGLAFDARDANAVTFDDLAAVAPQDWPTLRFALHPALQRLSFAYNVAAIRRALDRGEALPALEKFDAPQAHAVWRNGFNIRHRRLSDEEAALLARIADDASFAELCEALAASHAPDSVALHAATLLRTWVADGWIASIAP